MLLFPEVVKLAQKELDEVIGSDRMPSWEDRANLPYVRGVVAETLRCKELFRPGSRDSLLTLAGAPTPLFAAIPRSVARDDIYNGMLIPKGATIIMNVRTRRPLLLKTNSGGY